MHRTGTGVESLRCDLWPELGRRRLLALGLSGLGAMALRVPGARAANEGVVRSHGSTLLDTLRYPAGFVKTDYANAEAPAGGTVRLAGTGGFNSFNPFIIKGDPVNVAGYVFETLLGRAHDETSSSYGLLAEWIEWPKDFSWAVFKLRDDARWHDGRPVTVADVIFSHRILTTQGAPLYRFYYANVSEVRDVGGGIVRFEFDRTGNRELPHIAGELPVLPAHWWETRDFDQSTLEPPLGSGPYRVGEFEANRFVAFDRVAEYWGRDLPLRAGHDNFDRVRIDYYRDGTAAFEAFKTGGVDFRRENSAKRWATGYDFPAVKEGAVVVRQYAEQGPKSVQGFVFNLRRKRFADLRVRKALGIVFDFAWINRAIYFDQYAHPQSYFQGTPDLMPRGVPEGRELELLEMVRGQVPEEVFGPAFVPHRTKGDGRVRKELRTARRWLVEAGWHVEGGRLLDASGAPFPLEFLTAQADQVRAVNPYLDNLRQLGIDASVRIIDAPQYINRVNRHEFDMLIGGWRNSESPGNEQREYWGAAAAAHEGGRNMVGVRDPAVDALIERIVFAPDRAGLAAAVRALDRVLTHNHYSVLQLYAPFERIAYWDRFGHPEPLPARGHGFPDAWWWDAEKGEALAGRRG